VAGRRAQHPARPRPWAGTERAAISERQAPCARQGAGRLQQVWHRRTGSGARAGSPGMSTIAAITIIATMADFSRSVSLLPVITGTTTIITTTIPTATPTKIVTSATSAFTATGCADVIASIRNPYELACGDHAAPHAEFTGVGYRSLITFGSLCAAILPHERRFSQSSLVSHILEPKCPCSAMFAPLSRSENPAVLAVDRPQP
jgi:hypothetical protein